MKPSKTFWSNILSRSGRAPWLKVLGWCGRAVVTAIAVVVVIYLVYLAFMPISDIIARHDVGTMTGPGRAAALQAARDAARGRMLAALAGLVALGALVYTARTFGLSREGQVTDRFAKAVGQLGDTSLEVRVGGIYALELIARDSRRNQQAVMELLATCAREQSEHTSSANRGGHMMLPDLHDVHVAVAVIGRRRHKRNEPVDLSNTKLADVHLDRAHLGKADLTRADLTGAFLEGANLEKAHLEGACLKGAHLNQVRLYHAHLNSAYLNSAYLNGAHLAWADLTGADLNGAHLEQANLAWAHLTGADLRGACLDGAILGETVFYNANLENVDLTKVKTWNANWGDAHLNGALWPEGRPVPPSWQRDCTSSRLEPSRPPRAAAATGWSGSPAPGA